MLSSLRFGSKSVCVSITYPTLNQDMLPLKVSNYESSPGARKQKLIQLSCCELFKSDLQDWEGYSAFDVTFAMFYDVRC